MISRTVAPALTAACGAALLLGACTAQPIPRPPPPPAAEAQPPLLGEQPGPPDETGLLGGPPAPGAESGAPSQATVTFRQGEGTVVSTLRTIPEQEAAAPPPAKPPRPARKAIRPHAPARTGAQAAEPPAPQIEITPPAPLVSATPAQTAAPAPAPQGPLAQAPQAPFVQALPLAAPADPTLAALQRGLTEETARGSTLVAPTAVTQGGSGQVSLRLPADLMARLQAEAGKLGLARAARSAEVSARLTGEGYRITPPQNQTVPLKTGEAIVFNWQVEPAAAPASGPAPAPGALTARADAALTGDGAVRNFALVALEQAPPTAAAPAPSGGQTSAKWVLVSILVLLAALVLGGVFRNHAERRRAEAERRRRDRTARTFEPPRPLAEVKAEAEAEAKPES